MNAHSPKISAPLGGGRVRPAPRLPQLVTQALSAVEERLAERPDTYVLWSGGKDSTVCLDLARRINPSIPVVFFDSGMEFRQTQAYLHRLARDWNLDLHTFPAEPSALDVMEASGQWEHGVPKVAQDDLHAALILRPLARAREQFGNSGIYGLRADESVGRLGLLSRTRGEVITHDRKTGAVTQIYLAPIWRWSFEEVHAYLHHEQIPANPLYAALVKRGVPERRARVGMLVDGWALDQGRWGHAMALDPDLARRVEARLPALAEWR